MKHHYLIIILSLLIITSCQNTTEKKSPSMNFSGLISNPNSNFIEIFKNVNNEDLILKKINLDEKGSFNTELNLTKGMYYFGDGKEFGTLYVTPNTSLHLILDAKHFDESLNFTGSEAEKSNYFAKETLLEESIDYEKLLTGDSLNLIKGLEKYKKDFIALLNSVKGFDSITYNYQKEKITSITQELQNMYSDKQSLKGIKGRLSPDFTYENINGDSITLSNYRGKHTLVTIWASWCKSCEEQVKALNDLKIKFKDQNINFVDVSIDKDKDEWKKAVLNNNLSGEHVNNNNHEEFISDYFLEGIPRYILLDEAGIIIDADAPKPANGELEKLINSIKL